MRDEHARQTAESKAVFEKELLSLGEGHEAQLQALKVDTEEKLTAANKALAESKSAHEKELADKLAEQFDWFTRIGSLGGGPSGSTPGRAKDEP